MKMRFQKTLRFILVALFVLSMLLLGTTKAQEKTASKIPSQILFNGYLTDKTGVPYSNSYYKFAIFVYDSPESKTPIYNETHENVLVKDGSFTISIGSQDKSNSFNLQFDKKYYIGIKLNDEAEMSQRLELGSTAYSLGARYANTVADSSITTDKIADNSITDDNIQSFSIEKIINLPSSVSSYEELKSTFNLAGSDYEWWTTFGNLIYGPERHFLGTRNDKNFVIKTNEIQRMRFDPYGYIVLGTVKNPVNFEVFGYSTFDYVYIQGKLGVGVDTASAKVHINSPLGRDPFWVEYQNSKIFTIDTLGRVVITSSLSGNDADWNNYPLAIQGGEHGVGVHIAGTSDGANNYVSFWETDGVLQPGFGIAGRIEGQSVGDYAAELGNIARDAFIVELTVAEVIAATSFVPGTFIPKEPADIIRIAADLAELLFIRTWEYTHLGITYQSGSGDYAEWLERANVNESITPGDIVGVNGGKISLNTENAEQYFAVSTSPIILGNMQKKDEQDKFEKAAFMGQIPVKVRGTVNCGDYIIPSGLNDGTGLAVAPELMTIDEYDKIVGRAWSSSSNESVKLINVCVGVTTNDIGQLLSRMKKSAELTCKKEEAITQSVAVIKAKLEALKQRVNGVQFNSVKAESNKQKTSTGLANKIN